MTYTLKNDFYTLAVDTLGAEMISLKSASGRELLWQNELGEGWKNHAPILFPFCGRLKDKEYFYKGKAYPMAIHGFAMRTEFSLFERSDDKITLLLSASDETREIYPFDFKLFLTYALNADLITLSVRIENNGREVMPYAFGWHPGFARPTENGQDIEDYSVKLDNKTEITRAVFTSDLTVPGKFVPYPTPNSEYKLNEEEIYSHDTMVFRDAGFGVRLTADGYPYELKMTWSDNLPVLCIWKMPKNEAKYICIEPWSHTTARGEGCNDIEVRPMYRLATGASDNYEYTLKFTL